MPDAGASTPMPLAKRALWTVTTYAAALGVYFAAGSIAAGPRVSVATPLDDVIPFVPAAQLGYALVYVVPVSTLWIERTEEGFRRLFRAVLLGYLVAAPFFAVMPVADADPPLVAANWMESLLLLNRAADHTKNAFPSMHVGLAVLLALVAGRRSRAWGAALASAAVVISVATLLVKQHFVVDLPAGAIVGYAAYRVVYGKASVAAGRAASALVGVRAAGSDGGAPA